LISVAASKQTDYAENCFVFVRVFVLLC